MNLSEEDTVYLLRVLQERRRALPSEWYKQEESMLSRVALTLVAHLHGTWWVQRHGGSSNHEWKTIATFSEYSRAREFYEAKSRGVHRGAVALVYRPAAQRLRALEISFYLADEKDAKRVRRAE